MPQSRCTLTAALPTRAPSRWFAFGRPAIALAFLAGLGPCPESRGAASRRDVRPQGVPRSQYLADIRSLSAEIAALEGAAVRRPSPRDAPEDWASSTVTNASTSARSGSIAALIAAPAKPRHLAGHALRARPPADRAWATRSSRPVTPGGHRRGRRRGPRSRRSWRRANSSRAPQPVARAAAGARREVVRGRDGRGSAAVAARRAARRSSSPGRPRLRRSSAWASGRRGPSPIVRAAHRSALAPLPRPARARASWRCAPSRGACGGTPATPSGVPTARLSCASRSRASGASTTRERRASTCRCSRRPTAAIPPMLDLTRRFEQIWYGNRARSPTMPDRLTDHLEALGCLRPGERAI